VAADLPGTRVAAHARRMTTLDDAAVRTTLDRLHDAARGDWWFFAQNLPLMLGMVLGREGPPPAELSHKMKDGYIPGSREQGCYVYGGGGWVEEKRIVEFGTSFGVSTIYAAAAARDTGGRVIGSELEPEKRERALANLRDAGLADLVDVRLGDAMETLRDV